MLHISYYGINELIVIMQKQVPKAGGILAILTSTGNVNVSFSFSLIQGADFKSKRR